MAKQPSNGPLIAAVGIVLLLLLGANMMAEKNNPEIAQKLEQEKEAKEAEGKPSGSPTPPGALQEYNKNDLASLGDDTVIGPKDAKTKIVIGYGWTPTVQGEPKLVYDAVDHLQRMAQDASIEVANIDLHPNIKPGISVNGVTLVPLRPDGGLDMNGDNMKQLMGALKSHPQ